jgi:hypothetical protein
MIGVPPDHEPGQKRPAFGSEDSQKHFTETAFLAELASHISGRIGSNRDVLLYAAFPARANRGRRALRRRCGALYMARPGSLLDYGAAKESATIARDALSKLLHRLSELPDIGRCIFSRIRRLARDGSVAGKCRFRQSRPQRQARRCHARRAGHRLERLPSTIGAARSVACLRPRRLQRSRAFAFAHARGRPAALGALDPNNPSDRAALEDLGVKAYDLSRESGTAPMPTHPKRCARLARRSPNCGRRGQRPGRARRKTRRFKNHGPVPLAPLAEASSPAANPPPGVRRGKRQPSGLVHGRGIAPPVRSASTPHGNMRWARNC